MMLPLFLLFGSLIMVRRLLSSQRVDYFGYLCETDRKLTKERRSLFFFFFFFAASDGASEAGHFQQTLWQSVPAFMQL